MHLSVVVLLVGCYLAFSTGLPNQDPRGLSYEDHRQHAQFGEGIRDWFQNVRDRIFNRQADKMLQQAQVDQLQNQQDNATQARSAETFFLNLSTLTFDPEQDWGFHIGRWYFIRMANRNVNSYPTTGNEWDESYPIEQRPPDDNNWGEENDTTFKSTTRIQRTDSTGDPEENELAPIEPLAATEIAAKEEEKIDEKVQDHDEHDDESEAEVLIP